MGKKSFSNKTVIMRVDWNLSLTGKEKTHREISDLSKIMESVGVIMDLFSWGARSIHIITHQGRPGKKDFASTRMHAIALSESLKGFNVRHVCGCKSIKKYLRNPEENTVYVWENIRMLDYELSAFERHEIKNVRILIPRAEQAREVLPERLREMGAHVDVVPAYRTIRTTRDAGPVREMLASGAIDMITFTSPSTVTNFVEMLRDDPQADPSWMSRVTVACIGPITAETARKNGLSVNLVPDVYTIESLTKGIVDYFASR